MPRPVHDLCAVRRPPRTAVVAWRRREAANVRAVDIHRVDVQVAVLERREDDALTIRREHTFCGVDVVIRQAADTRPVSIRGIDVEAIESPDVTLRRIWARRAGRVVSVRGSEKQSLPVRQEPATRRLTAASGNTLQSG